MFKTLQGRTPGYGYNPEAKREIPDGVTHETTVEFLETARQISRIPGADDDRRLVIGTKLVELGMSQEQTLSRITKDL